MFSCGDIDGFPKNIMPRPNILAYIPLEKVDDFQLGGGFKVYKGIFNQKQRRAYFYIRNLYCGHLELDEYDDIFISKSRRDHGSKCASLDVKETESGQGSGAFNFLKDRKSFFSYLVA